MSTDGRFDPVNFTPYLLNMAAEASSAGFQPSYRREYGMLRTEWRVLFHLGHYGAMTAKDICDRAQLHKTKVSRAVAALERKRFLMREQMHGDKRKEELALTRRGRDVFHRLSDAALAFDAALLADFTSEEQEFLRRCLRRIAHINR